MCVILKAVWVLGVYLPAQKLPAWSKQTGEKEEVESENPGCQKETKSGFVSNSLWHKEHQEDREIIKEPFETAVLGVGAQLNRFLLVCQGLFGPPVGVSGIHVVKALFSTKL